MRSTIGKCKVLPLIVTCFVDFANLGEGGFALGENKKKKKEKELLQILREGGKRVHSIFVLSSLRAWKFIRFWFALLPVFPLLLPIALEQLSWWSQRGLSLSFSASASLSLSPHTHKYTLAHLLLPFTLVTLAITHPPFITVSPRGLEII